MNDFWIIHTRVPLSYDMLKITTLQFPLLPRTGFRQADLRRLQRTMSSQSPKTQCDSKFSSTVFSLGGVVRVCCPFFDTYI